jgi:hypothetical protein
MPAPHFVKDAAHWRQRATEMRALAAQANNNEAQTVMLRLAKDYDNLALKAGKRTSDEHSN